MEGSFSYTFTMEMPNELKSYFEAMFHTEDKKQWSKAKASAEEVEYEEYKD